jgi:anti-anti-sigma regulatory factor
MDYTLDVLRNADHTLVTLKGELTVKNARRIATQLKDVSESRIVVELNDPETTDLSFIQILAAWFNQLSESGATIELKASLKEADKALLIKTGFANFFRNYDTNF